MKAPRIYLAGASAEADSIAIRASSLSRAGWEIALPWWQPFIDGQHISGADRSVPTVDRHAAAAAEMAAVARSATIWLLVPANTSTGAWVELGIALARSKHTVVSGDWRRTIFSEIASCRFDSHDAALAYLVAQVTA